MIGFLIFSIIIFLICSILAIVIKGKDESNLFSFLSGGTLILCITLLIAIEEKNNTPTALDAYQGKTTLEITYRDSIPVDSVVVFKVEI